MHFTQKGPRLLFAFVLLWAALFAAQAMAGIDQASVDKCKTCHEDVVNAFLAGSHHGKVWSKGYPDKSYSCESCHGNSDKHIAAGGSKDTIIRFTKDSKNSADEQSRQCLGCHQKAAEVSQWGLGVHKRNDVSCSACHSIHKPGALKPTAETCFTCHRDIRGQMQKVSHHPVIEGKIGCADCHNPHGSTSHAQLRADNVNLLCDKCHQDKRGPFMFEHPPVEENCSNCHTVHGSNHPPLLQKPLPFLCKDCHEGPHGAVTATTKFVGRACMNCHNRIHGSNGPGGTFFTR